MSQTQPIKQLYNLLSNLPLSLKILASTGLILLLGITSSDWLLYQKSNQMLMTSAWKSMHLSLKQQSEHITQYLDKSRHDAIFLSRSPIIQRIIKDIDHPDPSNLDSSKDNQLLSGLFSSLIEEKGYLQVRLIDLKSGMEVVRVNRPSDDNLIPDITNKKFLQNKKDTQYVKIGSKLKNGQVYVSDINLNREYDKIVKPLQPTQRFVVGIFEEDLTAGQFSASNLVKYIRRFDLELTLSVTRAVQTGNLAWKEHYNYNAPKLDTALTKALNLSTKGAKKIIKLITSINRALIKIESKTFSLVAKGETDKAHALITGEQYLRYKKDYKNQLNTLIENLESSGEASNSYDKPKAILVINTNFKDILSTFRSIKTHDTKLVNAKGQFLYHQDKSKQFNFEFEKNAETIINKEKNIWSHMSKNINGNIEFDDHGELHASQRIFFNGRNNEKFIGLVLTKNKQDVLAPVIELGKHAFIISLVAFTFSLLSIFWIIRIQTKPITDLTNQTMRISNGDLSENLPPSRKTDEVGKLTSAFSSLIIKLQEQNKESTKKADQIKQFNRDLEKKIHERTASLKDASILAESSSKAKSEFLATMSHEIRTPLNGMLGMAQILSETTLNAQQESYVNTINNSGKSLLSIINDILDFSKMESGHLQLEIISFNLEEIFQDAIQLLLPRTQEKEISLFINYSEETPKYFYGDQEKLRQVVLNLLGNAIKFTQKGHVTLSVSSNSLPGKSYELTVSVKDTGIGIPKDDIAKLFGVFQQADASTTRKFGGTGLGLAISKKIIELMDGKIGINSTEGEGSDFWFKVILPDATASQKNALPTDNSPEKQINTDTKKKLSGRVLLVEDNQINQMVAQDMIERTGLSVDIAENGVKAIELWQKNQYDLILMDCLMPEMDGFEATRNIRLLEKDQRIPIVALTANVLNSDKQACKDAGMDDFVGKPIVLSLLNSTLEKWVKK
jgi:signal transduction histidine kinase/CheY-like chemotaxis protein